MRSFTSKSPRNTALAAACCWLLATAAHAQMLNVPVPPVATDSELALAQINDVAILLDKLEEHRRNADLRQQAYVLKRLTELRPYAGGLQWELARVYAQRDDKSAAYNALIVLQQQGFNFDPNKDDAFKKIAGTGAYKYIVEGLVANAKPFGDGKVALTVQSDVELIESISHDPIRDKFIVASAKTGEIFLLDAKGQASPFIKPDAGNGLFGVYSLLADAKRDVLYVGSTALPSYVGFEPSKYGQGGVSQFQLSTGKFLKRIPLPFDGQPHALSAMAIAKSGELYAADAIGRTVYQLRDGKFRQLFQSPELSSLRGLAISEDHKWIYFTDFEFGLHIADLGKNEIRNLKSTNQNLGGIDGIYLQNKQLFAIQNGTTPTRVLRIILSPEGNAIAKVIPVEANKPELTAPTFGALVGNKLYFIANSQRDLYAADGKILDGEKPERRKVYVVSTEAPAPAPAVPTLPAAK